MAKKKKKAVTSSAETTPARSVDTTPKLVTDLGELEALTAQAVVVEVLIKGRPFRFEGRRLKPWENADIKLLMRKALPPELAPEKPGDDPQYDFTDETFLKTREANRRSGRALTLWRAFPVFIAKCQGSGGKALTSSAEITSFVENLYLDDDVLEQLFRAATADIAEVERYISFISGNSSLES